MAHKKPNRTYLSTIAYDLWSFLNLKVISNAILTKTTKNLNKSGLSYSALVIVRVAVIPVSTSVSLESLQHIWDNLEFYQFWNREKFWIYACSCCCTQWVYEQNNLFSTVLYLHFKQEDKMHRGKALKHVMCMCKFLFKMHFLEMWHDRTCSMQKCLHSWPEL